MLFPKVKPRKFTFVPYYCDRDEAEKESDGHRIKFRRIKRRTPPARKSVFRMVLLAILIIYSMYYFWGLVEKENQRFKIEDIRIEGTPTN